MTDLKQRIDKLRELDKARTQGEWSSEWCNVYLGETGEIYDEGGHTKEDAQFIAAAPEMMQVIEELQSKNASMRETIKKMAEALMYASNLQVFKNADDSIMFELDYDKINSALELAKPWLEK